MEYCGPRGIPHDGFLEWSRSSRDKALWWLMRDRQKCGECHTRAEEWDPKQGGHRRAYKAAIVDCEGCIVVERTQAAPEMSSGRGKKIVLLRNEAVF